MSLPRRLALLAWAERARGWIIEDDYDGDLRFAGRPLASLQALDPAGRVIYVGTFNKMLFSALRLAYLVVPLGLVDACLAAKHMMDGHVAGHTQAALARFIQDGYLATHLRRLVSEYDQRRHALLTALDPLADDLEVGPSEAGLHLAVYLRRPLDDRAIAAECAGAGVDLHPLSRFYLGPPRAGFVMGFACSRPARTHAAIRIVGKAIRSRSGSARKVVR
jgi:GntR family transcriptional regulator/MocR family aminotransferase